MLTIALGLFVIVIIGGVLYLGYLYAGTIKIALGKVSAAAFKYLKAIAKHLITLLVARTKKKFTVDNIKTSKSH